MPEDLFSLTEVIGDADALLRAGRRAAPWTWPTGFALLDTYLSGGLRAGELCLLGGPQGLGKTTFAMQVARSVAVGGGSSVVCSFEHDAVTLLGRMIALEAGEQLGLDGTGVRRIREVLEGAGGMAAASLEDRLALHAGGAEALAALRGYGHRLMVHRSRGSSTDLPAIAELVAASAELTGRQPLLVVDYLQKVHVPGGGSPDERATVVVEGLKDLALELEVPVLAVVAADREGITSGRRLRIHHLRGSTALAYEPDVVLILNDKYDVVARRHLVYDTTSAERFRGYVVLSVEKNRSGLDQVDLQLRKRFEQSRFETEVQPVVEQLVDERLFVE